MYVVGHWRVNRIHHMWCNVVVVVALPCHFIKLNLCTNKCLFFSSPVSLPSCDQVNLMWEFLGRVIFNIYFNSIGLQRRRGAAAVEEECWITLALNTGRNGIFAVLGNHSLRIDAIVLHATICLQLMGIKQSRLLACWFDFKTIFSPSTRMTGCTWFKVGNNKRLVKPFIYAEIVEFRGLLPLPRSKVVINLC